MQATGRDFQHGSNFCVSLDPSCWLWCTFFSWKSVFTTSHCMKLCETSSVFRHELLSNFNNIQISCVHTKFAQFVLLWQVFNLFYVAAIEDLCWLGDHNSKVLLSWSHLARMRNSIFLPQLVSPVLSWWVSYSSHISATAPQKTELVCTDNCAKHSLNRFQIGCIVYRQFSNVLCFWVDLWTMGL